MNEWTSRTLHKPDPRECQNVIREEETLCRRRLPNITRRHQSITPTHPSITRKRLSIMRADSTKKPRTTHIQREPTSFMPEDTVKRRRRPISRSTERNRRLSGPQGFFFGRQKVARQAVSNRRSTRSPTAHANDSAGLLPALGCWIGVNQLPCADNLARQNTVDAMLGLNNSLFLFGLAFTQPAMPEKSAWCPSLCYLARVPRCVGSGHNASAARAHSSIRCAIP
jgi:hypothetical protein